MEPPDWAHLRMAPIDFQALSYYSAPKSMKNAPKSLDEVDPKLLETYEKLGVPLHERARLAGVAVDAVFDSVSVGTTFRKQLAEVGVIFCSFSHAGAPPELIERYLGTVVPQGDNFYAALNSAVFSDGSFVYIPKGVKCPMELSSYFRINAQNTGQFERTLIIAEEGSQVSYLEGCTAPQRDENQLHAAVVELIARRRLHQVLDRAELVPGDAQGAVASTTSSPSAAWRRRSARASPGRRSRPARPSPGSTPAWCCAATTPAANSTPSPCPTTSSRRTPAPR
jgi:Fe-S cluster assembly scaffold protein SufB